MVKLEILSGSPPCPGCVAIIELARRISSRYSADELELSIYEGEKALPLFEQYRIDCVPAAIINGTIRIEGMCPSEATLNNALREGGLCLK